MTDRQEDEGPVEIAIVGDLTDSEADLTDRLLGIEQGGECTIYFDSPGGGSSGGSAAALALASWCFRPSQPSSICPDMIMA